MAATQQARPNDVLTRNSADMLIILPPLVLTRVQADTVVEAFEHAVTAVERDHRS